jgi:hypothetical protein
VELMGNGKWCKDGPKRFKKNFSMILEKVFEMV